MVYEVLKYFTYRISHNVLSMQLCIACWQPMYVFVTEQSQCHCWPCSVTNTWNIADLSNNQLLNTGSSFFYFYFKWKHLVFTRSKFHSYFCPKTDITAYLQFIFITQNWAELCFFLISDMLLNWLNCNMPTGDWWK
jgi:hypothetical protein